MVIDNASNYEVCIEKIYAPVNSVETPIDLNELGYAINLFVM